MVRVSLCACLYFTPQPVVPVVKLDVARLLPPGEELWSSPSKPLCSLYPQNTSNALRASPQTIYQKTVNESYAGEGFGHGLLYNSIKPGGYKHDFLRPARVQEWPAGHGRKALAAIKARHIGITARAFAP